MFAGARQPGHRRLVVGTGPPIAGAAIAIGSPSGRARRVGRRDASSLTQLQADLAEPVERPSSCAARGVSRALRAEFRAVFRSARLLASLARTVAGERSSLQLPLASDGEAAGFSDRLGVLGGCWPTSDRPHRFRPLALLRTDRGGLGASVHLGHSYGSASSASRPGGPGSRGESLANGVAITFPIFLNIVHLS